MKDISIIIPACNEERGIAGVINSLLSETSKLAPDFRFEIIVVNDGSTDNTEQETLKFESEGVTCITQKENQGYGASLKRGIHAAKHEWIIITDADGTYPNDSITHLLEHIDSEDMVVGARTGAIREVPMLRRPPKWVLNRLASTLSRRNIPDLNSGFRLMKKDIVKKYFHILPDGFSFTTTITLAMLSAGYRVTYVPINYHKREGKSKIRPIYDTVNFLQLIIRTVLYFEPLRIFLPMSFIFFVSALLWLGTTFYLTGKIFDTSTILLFSTSIQVLAIGMLADMMNRRIG